MGKIPAVFVILISLAVILLSACTNGRLKEEENQTITQSERAKQNREKDDKEGKSIVIGAAIASADSPYLESVIPYMEEAAKIMNVKLTIEYADWDAKIQSEQMDSFIREQVDAIILCPINAKSMLTSLKRAKEAGIPVINLNMKVDSISTEYIETYVGASMSEEAALAADFLVEALGSKGGEAAIIEGSPGSDAQIYRTQTFMEQLASHTEIKIVAIGNGTWDREKAYLVTKDIVTKNPDLSAIFSHDSNMAMGVIKALEEMKKQDQILVIGIGEDNDEYLQAVRDGKLAGLITQPPSYEGKYSVYCAILAAEGSELRPWYKDPVEIITKDNVKLIK